MIEKLYIWNDLHLIKSDIDFDYIQNKLNELKSIFGDSICILNNIDNEFKNKINKLNNIVVIGKRPQLFISKYKKKYIIDSKRIIEENGFASDCIISIDKKIYSLEKINIIEDIIVSGTTIRKIIDKLKENNHNQKINVYFLMGFKNAVDELKKKYNDINIDCFNVLEEKAIEKSTCIFLSDLLFETLGNITYIEHIRNVNLFGSKTETFISKIKEIKDSIRLKAGIVTITIGINYGNRLQNYALQESLKKLEIESITFKNIYQEKELTKKIKRYFLLRKKRRKYKEQIKSFKLFDNKYINIKYKIKSFKVPKYIDKKFDYFICGSDQIWNPYFIGNTGTNFLTFANKEKTIAYAPSFGTYEIPQNRKKEYKEYLDKIKYLSCREEDGVKIIRNLTNKNAELVLDPTLLLNSKEWDDIAEKPNFEVEKDYVITYFLGKKENEYKDYIEEICKRYNLETLDIMDVVNIKNFSINPSQFLYLIKNAKLICTDSFHGTIFSIIYNKPYILFDRSDNMNNMNSRFDTLNKLLELPDRSFKRIKIDSIFDIDFKEININVNKQKEKSINYLKKSINYWE